MRFVYVTDLHGDTALYEDVLAAAVKNGASLIVNGGDILPKTGDGSLVENQRRFFGWLRAHLTEVRRRGVAYAVMFGNDDCASLLPELDGLKNGGLLQRLDEGWITHAGWHLAGFPWVPDTPFLLKDWTRLDHAGWKVPRQYGPPMRSTPDGFTDIGLSSEYHHSRLETIKDMLNAPPYSAPPGTAKCVFVMHAPPLFTGLDVCWEGRGIGSKAGLDYIMRWKFPLTLHGHIHEAPQEPAGAWHAKIGGTFSLNPGADGSPSHVLIDTEKRLAAHARYGEVQF